jgi:hypothetical protein
VIQTDIGLLATKYIRHTVFLYIGMIAGICSPVVDFKPTTPSEIDTS